MEADVEVLGDDGNATLAEQVLDDLTYALRQLIERDLRSAILVSPTAPVGREAFEPGKLLDSLARDAHQLLLQSTPRLPDQGFADDGIQCRRGTGLREEAKDLALVDGSHRGIELRIASE